MTHDRQLARCVSYGKVMMLHGTHFVQTGLSIEQNNVPVNDMSFNDVTNRQSVSDSSSISEFEELLVISSRHKVGTWVNVRTIPHCLLQDADVMWCDAFRVCEDFGDALGHSDLVDSQVGIRRDDRSAREVDTLSGKITAEPTLFPL